MMNNGKQYKTSKYNLFLDSDDDHFLFYNTRSGAFGSIPSSLREELLSVLNNPNAAVDEYIKKELIAGGLIVDADSDEIAALKTQHLSRKARQDILGLVLMTSESCNFRCPYCFVYDYRGFNMKDWVYTGILNLIERAVVPKLFLHLEFFGGEPLLAHRQNLALMTKINALKEKHQFRGLHYQMLTNGYLLTQKRFSENLAAGLKTYQITLDGPKERHDRTRFLVNGQGTFDVIWNNLLSIKELKDDFKVLVRVNFLKRDEAECAHFMELFKESFGCDQRFRVYFYHVWNNANKRNSLCNLTGDLHSFEEGRLKAMEYDFNYSKTLQLMRDKKFDITDLPYPRNVFCGSQISNYWIVGADGLLFKCDTFVGNKDYACARLYEDGTIEKFAAAKEWDKAVYHPDNARCLDCTLLPVCQGGCTAFKKRNGSGCFYSHKLIYSQMLNAHKFLSKQYQSFNRVEQLPLATPAVEQLSVGGAG